MSLELKNLDDVEAFMREYLPKWEVRRGSKTSMVEEEKDHASDYEVVQIFTPDGKDEYAFAEFWKGYYSFAPDGYTGFCGGERGHYHIIGGLDYIMRDVLDMNRELESVPKVLKAIQKASEKDENLKKVYAEIKFSDVRRQRNTEKNVWYVDCSRFRCEKDQACAIVVHNLGNTEYTVNFRIFEVINNGFGYARVSQTDILVNVEDDE